jgi:3-dehydroquinate synthase
MNAIRVPVSLGDHSYDVVIGQHLLSELRDFAEAEKPTTILLVTDSNVRPLHADAIQNAVVANHVLTVPAGEASKSLDQLGRLYDDALGTRRLDRRSLIVALGGGVVGDLAGFAAATLLRGIRYVQVPTTLLAMVDSSIGGKTAINHVTGKNLIGAFHQPAAVFCDMHFLRTLPEREYISALAEVVKAAALAGPDAFGQLERDAEHLLARDLATLVRVVETCVRFKAAIVSGDERETSGSRALLNLGHSLAHVLETVFPDRYLHGEAVSVGIVAAMRLSVARAQLPASTAARVRGLLARFKLPLDPPPELAAAKLISTVASDKKRSGDVVNFVVLSDLGAAGGLPCRLNDELASLLLGTTHA